MGRAKDILEQVRKGKLNLSDDVKADLDIALVEDLGAYLNNVSLNVVNSSNNVAQRVAKLTEEMARASAQMAASSSSADQQARLMVDWTRKIFWSYVVIALLTLLLVVAQFMTTFTQARSTDGNFKNHETK